MAGTYRIIREKCSGEEIAIKKSRFLSDAMPVHSQEEAAAFIEECRKKYYDAKHHCYAYSCGDDCSMIRCSDDGEPQGTAGRPILEVINGSEIHDIVIVVTRYFGGTLLGTGGLVRAYTEAAKAVITAADIVKITHGIKTRMKVGYTDFGKIRYELEKDQICPIDITYESDVSFTVTMTCDMEKEMIGALTDITGGKLKVINRTEGDYEF